MKNIILSIENTKLLNDESIKTLIQEYAGEKYYIEKTALIKTNYDGIYTYNAVATIKEYNDLPIEKQLKLYIVDFDFNKTERAKFLNGEIVKGFKYNKDKKEITKVYDLIVIARV